MNFVSAPLPINEEMRAQAVARTGLMDLNQAFEFKENQFAGVFVYNYVAEATAFEIKISSPSVQQ